MLKIENRFVVMSLLEDLLFPQISKGDELGVDAAAIAAAAAEKDLPESCVEIAPKWEENPELRSARLRAVKHLPSLALTMGYRWSTAEVAPYIERCLAEEDKALGIAVIATIPQLMHVTAVMPAEKSDPQEKTVKVFTMSDFHQAFVMAAGARDPAVREAGIKAIASPMLRKAITEDEWLDGTYALASSLTSSIWPSLQASGTLLLAEIATILPPKEVAAMTAVLPKPLQDYLDAILDVKGAKITFPPPLVPSLAVATVKAFELCPSLFTAGKPTVESTSSRLRWLATFADFSCDVDADFTVSDAVLGAIQLTLKRKTEYDKRIAGNDSGLPCVEDIEVVSQAVSHNYRQPAWRTRWIACNYLSFVIHHLVVPLKEVKSFFQEIVSKLCDDYEAEVRAAVLKNLGHCVSGELLRVDAARHVIAASVLPELVDIISHGQFFVEDPSIHVRECLVMSLSDVCKALCELGGQLRQSSADRPLLKMIVDLLKDEATSVQLRVIEHLSTFIDYFGEKVVEAELLELTDKLTNAAVWRVRQGVLRVLPTLCLQFHHRHGKGGVFLREKLLPRLCGVVFDGAKSVRQAAISALCQLTTGVDAEFAMKQPKGKSSDALKFFTAPGSRYENSDSDPTLLAFSSPVTTEFVDEVLWPMLSTYKNAVESFGTRCTLLQVAFAINVHHSKHLLPMLTQYAEDNVVNVRLTVAKYIGFSLLKDAAEDSEVRKKLNSGVGTFENAANSVTVIFSPEESNGHVLELLRRLVADSDADVRYYAAAALTACV